MTQNIGRSGKRSIPWGLLAAGAVLVLLAASAYLFRVQLLTRAADFLVVDDAPLRPAEMLFVLNGDYNTRPFRAAELYRQGLAPAVVIAQSANQPVQSLGLLQNETSIAVAAMEKLGIPSEKVVVLPGGVTSTYDEALALRRYVQENDIHTVILVTSAFHTRRARWIITKELAGLGVTLQVSPVPYGGFDAANWWKSEDGLVTVNNEYVKLLYYYWKYR